MEFLGMESKGGDQVGLAVHTSLSIYDQTDEQLGATQEEGDNLFNEKSDLLIASPVYRGFDEDFSPPMYDKYEDDY